MAEGMTVTNQTDSDHISHFERVNLENPRSTAVVKHISFSRHTGEMTTFVGDKPVRIHNNKHRKSHLPHLE